MCLYISAWNQSYCSHSEGNDKMSYSNFCIFKEHKFLKNIFLEEELNETENLENIEIFHESFIKFLRIVIFYKNSLLRRNRQFFRWYTFRIKQKWMFELFQLWWYKKYIKDVEIKNNRNPKFSKFTLQIYAYVYKKNNIFSKREVLSSNANDKRFFRNYS